MDDALIRALKAAGVDVLTALEAGLIERPDYEHLAHATEQGRVLCTFNVGDLYRLHAERLRGGKRHAGIVLVPQQRYGPDEQARRLLKLLATLSPEEMENRVEFLSSWNPA